MTNHDAKKDRDGAARRALAEAEARRAAKPAPERPEELAKEIGGRKGPEPTRFGDWEKGGLAVDF